MDSFSFLSNADPQWIDSQYTAYKSNPESVDESWARFFEGFDFASTRYDSSAQGAPEELHKEFKVLNLINGYRSRGHLFTKTNPVRERRKYSPTLDLENFGLSEADLDITFEAGKEVGLGTVTLREIVEHLKATYCQSIGIEYMYIRDPERQQWIRNSIEIAHRPKFDKERKLQLFKALNRATVFEQYLQKKFVGQKRFSVEGGEAYISGLEMLMKHAAESGVRQVVMGMAHRGRLNTLANIFKKDAHKIFSEFEGKEYDDEGIFDGDVKYHLGYSNTIAVNGSELKMTLSPNPSHLETVDPVVAGLARGFIDQHSLKPTEVLPILVHGDAAIAAQGVVYEVIQMAQLDGYAVGGTIHLVINNQVGFTTNYLEARSSTYCTDVAKTTLCPVFHVNGDDVEAVAQTLLIALDYRQKFGRDVFIDLLCYRKYGHNEGDEPKFTQPKLYDIIAKHPNPREIYLKQLVSEGVLSEKEAESIREEYESYLDSELEKSKTQDRVSIPHFMETLWQDMRQATDRDFEESPDTSFGINDLKSLGVQMNTLPEKKFFRKITKLFEDRLGMLERDELDWAMGELLAYATLLKEGYPVRISGQDSERGTFSHRHAVLKTTDDEEEYLPLNHLGGEQARFTIYNSPLSEYGVMGFDYGYAWAVPNGLTIWEAQFGDFNNGAQIILDQFLSAAEDKWGCQNGLVLYLPHGYEGQGSEHSSGRLERFLTLSAELNIQVCNATTPANFYHLLRRQLKRDFRKPLVIFTPKKLLRYPKAVSSLKEMAKGRFKELIDDPSGNPEVVDTLAFCSGKIYYDLLEEREKLGGAENIALIRLEQLYPLPEKQINALLNRYKHAKKHIWVQEEPENMGAWSYMLRMMRKMQWEVIAPRPSGSPAPGSPRVHERRHQRVIDSLFAHAHKTEKASTK